jgi:hypothetical protein
MVETKCDLCGSDSYYPVRAVQPANDIKLRFVKCRRCGLVYANPRPPDEIIVGRLREDLHRSTRADAAAVLNTLKSIRKSGRLLYVSCADEPFAAQARNAGWDIVISGLSQAAGARKYPDNYFDAVVIDAVIGCIPNPKGILEELRKTLKADGILYVSCKTGYGAIYYFTRATLAGLLDNCGYFPLKINGIAGSFRGRVEAYCRKARKLEYLDELEKPAYSDRKEGAKIMAVLPAYNAADTLEKTVADIPGSLVSDIILVDDASGDDTVEIAEKLGLRVYRHKKRTGYGGNQKTCYEKALELGADIAIMVHPDYQYDPKIIPELVEPIIAGRADAVFGSRMMKGGALIGGMPPWKHNANILLTAVENVVFGTYLTEYHSGFRAYSKKALCAVDFKKNSDSFIFDTEIIAQLIAHNLKIEEVPIKTRYFDEASSIKLIPSIAYGLGILWTLFKFWLHTHTFAKLRQFR